MFQILDPLVKPHGDNAKDDDGSDDHIEFKHLRAINDQIPKASAGRQKFTDDHAYQSQADVHLDRKSVV